MATSTRSSTFKTKTFADLNKDELVVFAKAVSAIKSTSKVSNDRQLRAAIQAKLTDIEDSSVVVVERKKGKVVNVKIRQSQRGEQREDRQNEEEVDTAQSGKQGNDVTVEQENDKDDAESENDDEHEEQSSQTKRRSAGGKRIPPSGISPSEISTDRNWSTIEMHEEIKGMVFRNGLEDEDIDKLISRRIHIRRSHQDTRKRRFAATSTWSVRRNGLVERSRELEWRKSSLDSNKADPEKSSNSRTTAKLPKLEIPKFSGDLLQWNTFWQLFETNIHTKTDLSDVTKFSYLRAFYKTMQRMSSKVYL